MNNTTSSESIRFIRLGAALWLVYMLLLVGVAVFVETRTSVQPLYYAINIVCAMLIIATTFFRRLCRQPLYYPVVIVIVAALPIITSHLLLMRGQFPPSPLMGAEGLSLRLVPILFIGLILTAWRYAWQWVIVFSLATTTLGLALMLRGANGTMPVPGARDGFYAGYLVHLIQTISFIVVGYFISHLMHRLRDQQTSLADANTRLAHYAAALEHLTISRERNRVARELHDTVAHTLSGLTVQLETAKAYFDVDPPTARHLVEKSLTAARTGLEDTRRALKALRASPLDDLGLSLALQQLATTAAEKAHLQLSLSLPDSVPVLAPDVEQCLYRIAQEAIANVVYHANARCLSVSLQVKKEGLELYIVDDGKGFNPKQTYTPGHYGLAGMQERAALVGGQLKIKSQQGQGTSVRLVI
jgi:signal transduction histidine kinase